MATRVQRTTAEQATAVPIFQTVSSKGGELLRTEGTFTIVFRDKGSINPTIVFEGTYKDGQAYYDGEILPNYSAYIYPKGYFGISSGLSPSITTNVSLIPASLKASLIRQQQLNYINTKIGQNVIDNPKDGINAAV
jgi:hypothetical protein